MKLKNIELPVEEIERFCEKWNLTELSLFGSVLRDDFKPESSDIDVMVQYHPQSVPSFYDLDCMEAELKLLLNRDVDVITRASVENSTNYLRRKEILSSVKVIYESQPSVPA
ncbi:MAG: nucleotidyltransferase domain-containing protein [Cyanobacteria bacterium J06631_12]